MTYDQVRLLNRLASWLVLYIIVTFVFVMPNIAASISFSLWHWDIMESFEHVDEKLTVCPELSYCSRASATSMEMAEFHRILDCGFIEYCRLPFFSPAPGPGPGITNKAR